MASYPKEYEHLKIQLKEIKLATNNFDENNVIGHGGFGKVYKGELCHPQSESKSLVALKRLDRKHGQGDTHFWKEIRILDRYRHENIISLLGYCSEEGERILIYEHASPGSLERYLKDASLTWIKRIKICLNAAKGLSFLHVPNESQQRVLHCDIKSANILLDDNLNAKVTDFGLSEMGSAEEQFSVIITDPVGTPGYCDPLYMETYQLTKESDVYSFGVVLFEVLCGRQCVEVSNGQLNVLVPFWKKMYEENKLEEIIHKDLKQQMNPSALETFASIAYQCLKSLREERPSMSLIVEKLKDAFEVQERHDIILTFLLPKEYEEIVRSPASCLMYTEELKGLLSKGVLVNEGKTRLSINEKGEHIERIYVEDCVNPDYIKIIPCENVNSRFPREKCYDHITSFEFKAHVRGQYLTPQILYTLNLVFRYEDELEVDSYNPLRYKIDGEDDTKVFIIYPSTHLREDGWFVVPLYHFTSQHTTADLQFEFETNATDLLVAGFEFQPSEEKVELQVFEEYQHIVEAASQSLMYTSLDELKKILSKGVHLNGYKTWFSLNEKGEHCHMISMKDCLIQNQDFTPRYQSHHWSRFPAGFYDTEQKGFRTHVKTHLLNPLIPYTVNLAFYHSSSSRQVYVDLKYRINGDTRTSTVYLAKKRDDWPWLHMAELYQVTSNGGFVDLEIDFENPGINIKGVEGILFQPLEKVEDKVLEDDNVNDIQPMLYSDSDTYWGQKLPDDYEEILKLSDYSVEGKTKKELYSLLCQGFLIDNGQQWFTVDKNGKKCQMLSTRSNWVIDEKNSMWESSNESRFGEVLVITAGYKFEIIIVFKTEVSPKTTYAAYLVYKLPKESTFEAPLGVWEKGFSDDPDSYIYLIRPPHTPVIGPQFDENTYNPLNRYKETAIPQQRTDGWMEVKVWEFESTTETVSRHLYFKHPEEKNLKGLMVQGIELRPI